MTFDLKPKEMKFEFPNLFPETKEDEISTDMKKMDEELEIGKLRERRHNYKHLRHNVPNWFGL